VRKWGLAVLVLVMLLTTAAIVARRLRPARAPAPAREFIVQKGDVVLTVRETGMVEPFTKVEVKSKVGGRVLRVAVEEGERVHAGQLPPSSTAPRSRAR
jgi:HlyD family secretion protein